MVDEIDGEEAEVLVCAASPQQRTERRVGIEARKTSPRQSPPVRSAGKPIVPFPISPSSSELHDSPRLVVLRDRFGERAVLSTTPIAPPHVHASQRIDFQRSNVSRSYEQQPSGVN